MNERWSDFDDDEKQVIEEVVSALSVRGSILSSGAARIAPDVPTVAISDLYSYVNTPDFEPDSRFFEALEENPRTQRALSGLVERGAMCRFSLARVASSGTVDHREEVEFSIHTQVSQASPGRTIVAISIRVDRDVNPRWLYVETGDGAIHRYELPDAQGDQFQFMIPSESALIGALREANARVTLR